MKVIDSLVSATEEEFSPSRLIVVVFQTNLLKLVNNFTSPFTNEPFLYDCLNSVLHGESGNNPLFLSSK